MKGYYLFFGSDSLGVQKKIEMQMHELGRFFDITRIDVELNERTVFNKIKSRLLWCSWGYKYEEVMRIITSPDFIYIRRVTADADFIEFLSEIKHLFPNCKIVEEIYTYPYDKDDYNRNVKHFIKQMPFYIKDRFYRCYLKNYVDKFVTYSKDEVIFGVPTIRTTNGIDINVVKKKRKANSVNNVISLISVANMQMHHGYERLIKGIKLYYVKGGKRDIVYHMVGEGPELKRYKKMVKKLNIEDYVVFHGKRDREQLDALYNQADIGISSLGLYKYKIECISTLKICEYLAKGLPVIAGCDVSVGESESMLPDFIYKFENNSSPLDVYKIINFYDYMYQGKDHDTVTDLIREYAKNKFSMSYVMKPIIDYIIGDCK